jgi:tetratricopeptide (TPR) repeat protein
MSNARDGDALGSDAALSMLKQASSERRMEFVQAVMNRGYSLYHRGQFDSADVLFETMETEPAVRPMVRHIRGVIALHRGDDERALDLIEEAIRLNPADGEAHANLGLILFKSRQYPQALAAYASALTLRPNSTAAQLGFARALAALDMVDLAEESLQDVLARVPDCVEAVVDYGALLNDMSRHEETVALLRDAFARRLDHGELHTVHAVSLFALGDWPAAWAEYEWRLSNPQLTSWLLSTDRPRWRGEDLGGKTILLQSEQGYGDILQFVRYAPLVKARGGRVVLRAPQALLPLLRTVPGIDAVVGTEDQAPPFDVHVPLLSLPLIFGTQADTVPTAIPYLVPDRGLVARWRERLGTYAGLSVGLVWQGNPAHPNDRRRSIQLDHLRSLLDCPGVRFISLQVGPGREQLIGLEDRIVDAGSQIDATSFADAAAIVANLDLVISIDSAIAHLAGGLGKPVWVMLATASDWRWLKAREDTPWYPQARLFRQKEAGGWAEMVRRLRAALWALAGAPFDPAEEGQSAQQRTDPVAAATRRLVAVARTSDPIVCDALFVEACRQYCAKNVGRSKKLFERVLSLDPTHVNTLCNLAAVELGLGRGRRALALLQTAIVLAPNLAPARTALADALLPASKGEQALAQYRKAIELAPNSTEVHVAYAKGLQKLDDSDEVPGMDDDLIRRTIHQHFREALELAPNDASVHAEYALVLHGMGEFDQAMHEFLAATKISREQSPEFYEALGRTCAARNNSEGAEISLNHALALDPRRITAHCALGELYLALARPGDAAASFGRALAIDETNVQASHGMQRALSEDSAAMLSEIR